MPKVGLVPVEAEGSLGTGRLDGSLGTGRTSGSLGTGKTDGSLGTARTEGSLGTGRVEGSLGTGPLDGSLGAGRTSGSLAYRQDRRFAGNRPMPRARSEQVDCGRPSDNFSARNFAIANIVRLLSSRIGLFFALAPSHAA